MLSLSHYLSILLKSDLVTIFFGMKRIFQDKVCRQQDTSGAARDNCKLKKFHLFSEVLAPV